MESDKQGIISRAYAAFNARDIDALLKMMRPDVHWPNGWEGGFVSGHQNVRDYWTRQWKEIDPHVAPVNVEERSDGTVAVDVYQVVKDLQGNTLADGAVKHIYRFVGDLIAEMKIEDNLTYAPEH